MKTLSAVVLFALLALGCVNAPRGRRPKPEDTLPFSARAEARARVETASRAETAPRSEVAPPPAKTAAPKQTSARAEPTPRTETQVPPKAAAVTSVTQPIAKAAPLPEIREERRFKIARFLIAPPVDGLYVPWISGANEPKPLAGETISIHKESFVWDYFTDTREERRVREYTGRLKVVDDRVFLDHPEVAYPYRIAGLADGVPVLVRWRAYEEWKKSGALFWSDILFLHEERADSAPKQTMLPGIISELAPTDATRQGRQQLSKTP